MHSRKRGRDRDSLSDPEHLNKFWTRPSVAVQKDPRVSDKIQENMRVPDGCVRSETRCEWARRAELQARRCGSDAGFYCSGTGESYAVIPDFGEHAGAGRGNQTRETDNDRTVRMGLEQFSRRLAELIDIPAGGVECGGFPAS
jgi:hypothetical protein